MPWKKQTYVVHRWLALIVGLQLLAWSVGGFIFSILDIDDVHGDWERNFDPPPPIDVERIRVAPGDAIARAAEAGVDASEVVRATLRARPDGAVYELYNARDLPLACIDAESGDVVLRITPEEAGRVALADFTESATIRDVAFLEGEAPLEYRGKPMPVYRVILEHPKEPHLYVSPVTGEVVTRRNRPWRIFDFFWMLHIMDYGQRDDFNHWLLTTASALAILTSASGLVLWSFRIPRLGRRIAK